MIKHGDKFARLTVISFEGRNKYFHSLYKCICNCGKEVIVEKYSLISGNTKSCGCLASELIIARNLKHGLCNGHDRLYNIWCRMKQRCYDLNSSDYQRYGGRGIVICKEWLEYKIFHEWAKNNGYSDNLTIERINNSLNYNPENCKWIPLALQARNRRDNHLIEFKGETKILAEWSEIFGIGPSLIRYRLKHWPIDRIFIQPTK